MDDEQRSAAAAGQNDAQAQTTTAETDGGNQVSPQDVTPVVATEITPQSPVQTDTRRTSMSSRGGDNMQASQPSLGGGTTEGADRQQGERQRTGERDAQRRSRPVRLDYGGSRMCARVETGQD